ncbi:MAG: dehydrogenase E1 component subunit alpha/beta [Planctomycetes bacterium]|nr:dehydrogenase E1 component subunit alpha/beta [Planctomycetota bacterium]
MNELDLYRTMLVIRRSEEQLVKSHQRGLIHGACHTYIGQEAIATGVCAHLSKDDVVFSTHRGHGHALAKGVTPEALMAELYGRAAGVSRGRGGSMHLFAPEVGMMGTSGIVGPCILQAAGAGYSFALLKNQRVAVAFFGDGAVNNGAFHEGLNLAGIWKLPVLFVCENNQFATEVPFHAVAGNPSVAARGAIYGMPGIELDGNDVLAIRQAADDAVRRARAGDGPTLLECKTYRTRPHAEGMGDYTYRTRDDVESWKNRCPIQRLRAWLVEKRVATEAELDKVDADITAGASAANQRAEQAAWPDPATAANHVYAPRLAPDGRLQKSDPPASNLRALNEENRQITYMQATLEALTYEMAHNPGIFVLGEGIGQRGGNFKTTAGLYDIHGPQRLRDTPICERGFVGLGCGAAMTGSRPVIDFMFADFVLDSVGEIVNQIAKMQYMSSCRLRMPILLRGCVGIGHSAATHHSGNYYPMYAHFPGLRVVVPATPYDAKGLLHHALRCNDPVLFLEHRECLTIKGNVPAEPYEIPFGQAAIVREGKDVTVVALCYMVHQTLKACQQLPDVSVELIDPRTVAPLDVETITKSVAKTGRLLIVDEAFSTYGIGAEIAARLADQGFDNLDAPIKRLNGAHTPTPYSPTLEAAVVPTVEQIAAAIRDLLGE